MTLVNISLLKVTSFSKVHLLLVLVLAVLCDQAYMQTSSEGNPEYVTLHLPAKAIKVLYTRKNTTIPEMISKDRRKEDPLSKCSIESVLFGESCYGFGKIRVSWDTSVEMCRVFGGYLVEVSDAEENTFLQKELKYRNISQTWLGGSDLYHRGVWQWETSKFPITTELLNTMVPRPGRHCLKMTSRKALWRNDNCKSRHNFICEARLDAPTRRVIA